MIRTINTEVDAAGIGARSDIEVEFKPRGIAVINQVNSRIDGGITDTREVWNRSQLPVGTVAMEIVAATGLDCDAFEVAVAVCTDEPQLEQ